MASRRTRRSRLDRGSLRGAPSFLPVRHAVASAGRPSTTPWRSRLTSSLLRPVPSGYIGEDSIRATNRVLGDLRARRARTASAADLTRSRRVAQPLRQIRPQLPLGKPVLFRTSTPCDKRRERKEVMFARRVAGKRWRGKGPRMFGARFSLSSFFRCV